jgi:hypothetical protein
VIPGVRADPKPHDDIAVDDIAVDDIAVDDAQRAIAESCACGVEGRVVWTCLKWRLG